jgi:lysophospholipase L1-like esterase
VALLRRLVFGLVATVLMLGAAEVALRAADWPPPGEVGPNGFAHRSVYWVEPPNQQQTPHDHKETGGSFTVSTDANGLRAPVHAERKPDGAFRVMTLGCSTTFGWGVDDDAAYPARLEVLLGEAGKKVEVINAGQPGHTSFQGMWLWDTLLARYKPDVVVWGYLVQDARKVAYTDLSQAVLQREADFLKRNLLYKWRLYVAMKARIDDITIVAKDNPERDGVYRVPPAEYAANIRALKAKTDRAGARFVLFGFPLEREGYTGDHRRILHAASKVLDVPIFDPQPEMEEASRAQELYFAQDRGHANAAGLDWIARRMATFLVEQELIP